MSKEKTGIEFFIGSKVIHVVKPVFIMEKVFSDAERRSVVLMAVADGYAMVRRPRCCPYVVSVKELEPN